MWHLRDIFFFLFLPNYSNNSRESGLKHRNQRNKWSKKEVLSDARKSNRVQKSNSSPRVGIRQLQQMTAQSTAALSKVTKHQDVWTLGVERRVTCSVFAQEIGVYAHLKLSATSHFLILIMWFTCDITNPWVKKLLVSCEPRSWRE